MKMRKPWAAVLLCNLFLFLTVVFFLPLEVVLPNLKEFMIPFSSIWWLQLLIALALSAVLSGLMLLLPSKAGRIAAAFSLGLGLAFWAQSMFMNGGMVTLTGEEMKVSTLGTVLNVLAWIVLISLPVVLTILFGSKKKARPEKVLCLVAGTLLLMQTVAFASLAATTDTSDRKADHFMSSEGQFTLGKENNVIEFVLDTADEIWFNRMLEKYPEMEEKLAGFTYYANTTSVYSRTYPSITYLLTGEKCFFDREPRTYIDEAFSKSTYLKKLHSSGTDIRIFTTDSVMIGNNSGSYISNSSDYEYTRFDNLDLVALEKNIAHISLFKGAPYLLKNAFAYSLDAVNLTSFRSIKELAPFSDNADPDFYSRLFLYGLTKSDQYSKAYRFYHLWGVHPGFNWDDQLNTTETLHPVTAMRGSFMMLEYYFQQMKNLGLYDQATIIITADHGSSGGNTDDLSVPAAACPLILVKYPGSDSSQPLKVNRAPVSQEDLFATIGAALDTDTSEFGSGKSLADYREEEDRLRYYYYSALYSDGDGEIALMEYEIDGDANDLANWKRTGNWWNIDYSLNKVSASRYTEN